MANQRFSRFPFWIEAPSGTHHLLTEVQAESAADGTVGQLDVARTKCGREVDTTWGDLEPRTDLFHPGGRTCGKCC